MMSLPVGASLEMLVLHGCQGRGGAGDPGLLCVPPVFLAPRP